MIGFILILIFLLVLYLLINQPKPIPKKERKPKRLPKMRNDFVPVEDIIVPTSASQTNKMNNKLGNVNSSQGYGPGIHEVVIPSDYYQFSSRPGEYYWPSGSILPDYIYNGSVHKKITV
jgi:hypothetical protein